jgi:hypothetical protein
LVAPDGERFSTASAAAPTACAPAATIEPIVSTVLLTRFTARVAPAAFLPTDVAVRFALASVLVATFFIPVDFFAELFLVVDFFAGLFLAVDFFAGLFLAVVFFAGLLFVVVFFAPDFLDAAFLIGMNPPFET